MRCFFVWARALREQRPYLMIIENVPRFPLSLVLSLFDDLYTVEHCVLEAADTGAPARRRRLYCVLTLRRVARLSRPFSELASLIGGAQWHDGNWLDLFCLDGVDETLSIPVAKRASEYLDVFGDTDAIYDLDQLPRGRPRLARKDCPLFTLTAHTRLAWSPTENRCLRRAELGAAMGLPTHPGIACSYGTKVLSFDHLSRSAAGRLIGNGMSLSSVGAVIAWC